MEKTITLETLKSGGQSLHYQEHEWVLVVDPTHTESLERPPTISRGIASSTGELPHLKHQAIFDLVAKDLRGPVIRVDVAIPPGLEHVFLSGQSTILGRTTQYPIDSQRKDLRKTLSAYNPLKRARLGADNEAQLDTLLAQTLHLGARRDSGELMEYQQARAAMPGWCHASTIHPPTLMLYEDA